MSLTPPNPASPVVSVIMPVYNCVQTIESAIRSIQMQTYTNWELLLLEDGSRDGTLELARTYDDPRIRLFSDSSNRGIAYRLNQGIVESRGSYIARMDGDDISYPTRLQAQVEFMLNNPAIDLVATGALVFGEAGRPLGTLPCPSTHEQICRRPWAGFPLWHPSWLARREWFQRYRYLPNSSGAEDLHLLLRSYPESRFACLPDFLLGYRFATISRSKRWSYRRQAIRALWNVFTSRHQYGLAVQGVAAQFAKAAGDFILIGSPFEKLCLAHRRARLEEHVRLEWEKVCLATFSGKSTLRKEEVAD